jgi:hypothetical protein
MQHPRLYARSESLRNGAEEAVRDCRKLLRVIEQAMETRSTCVDSDCSGEHLEMIINPTPVDSLSLEGATS